MSYAPFFRGSKKAKIPTQNISVESISSSPKKKKHPDPKREALEHYLRLIRALGLVRWKTAYKVVISIPILHLGHYIDSIYFSIRVEKARAPSEFFKALATNKTIKKKEIIPDAEVAIRGDCCRKLAIELDVDLLMISRIFAQMTPNTLRDFLDKISEGITHTKITKGAKR